MDESSMNHYSLKQEDDSSYAPLMASNYPNPTAAGSLSRWSASQPNFSLQYQPYPSNLSNGNEPMLYQQPPQQQQQSSPLHDNSLPDLITNGLQFTSHAASTYPTPPMSSMSPSATISRPPSVVHSPHQEAFSRARATSYSGPYTLHPTFAMAEYQNYQQSQAQTQAQQQQQQQASYAHPLRMSIVAPLSAPVPAQQPQRAPHASEQPLPKSEPPQAVPEYYVAQGLDQYQAQASRTLGYLPDGNMTNRLPPTTPVTLPNPGPLAEGSSYTPTAPSTAGYAYTGNTTFAPPSAPASHTPLTNSSMQQDVRLRPPIPPLSTSIATGGLNAIPRSMSTGSIANVNGHGLPTGPYGAHGRYPRSSIAPLSSISIPQNGPMDRGGSEYDQIYSSPSSALSPSSGAIFSNALLHLRGTGSGPGTSNGGSVPLTPTTDDTDTTDHYNSFSRGNSRLSISNGYMDLQPNGSSVDDDMDDDDDEDTMNDSRPLRIRGIRRATKTGCNRTEKKRRSATIAAGPSAAAVGNRSRSGTMAAGVSGAVNGPSGLNPIGFSSLAIGMDDTTPGPLGTSVASMPFGALGEVGHGQGAGTAVAAAAGAHSAVGHPTGTSSHGHGMGGQTHSPLAMKELSPSIKPVIEDYLLRYLNYLCINPNAKDRMGHQIHQMYTARRIQRYEQLYGYRPLKFRIEAFVNGFVDLLTANGLSQDITMKIPHYLNSSNLFSRFNESGNRMKSQGQTIWRVKAKSRTDIPSVDVTGQTHHSASFAQHHAAVSAVGHAHAGGEDGPASGMMMCPDPLLWEFIPYERCIVGQPPLAIVGSAWQWNMKVHDHWTPRKKVTWKVSGGTVSSISSASSSDDTSSSSPSTSSVSGQVAPSGTGSATSGSGSTSAQGPVLCALPTWVQQQGAKLKGTPTAPGIYPIAIEATFQDDSDPEPLIVRGNFTIQVSRAIGGWNKTTVTTADGVGLGPGALGGLGEDAMDADDPDDDGSGGLNGSAGSAGGSVRDAHGNEHFLGGYGAYPTTYLGNPYPMTYNYPYSMAYVQ